MTMTQPRCELLQKFYENPKRFCEGLLPRDRAEKRSAWLRTLARAVGVTPRRMETIFYSLSAKCLRAHEWEKILSLHGVMQEEINDLQRRQAHIRRRFEALGNTHSEDNQERGGAGYNRAGRAAVACGDTIHRAG